MTDTQPRYSITIDERNLAVRLTVAGFWPAGKFAEVLRALDAAMLGLQSRSLPFTLVCDMQNMLAQDRVNAECIRQHFACTHYPLLRGIAIYGASTLVMIQHRRLYAAYEPQFFDSEGEALQWARITSLSRAQAVPAGRCDFSAAVAG